MKIAKLETVRGGRLALVAGALTLIGGASVVGCGTEPDDSVTVVESALLGDRLPVSDGVLFDSGKAAFDHQYSINDGLGPIYNGKSCTGCHSTGADGGSGDNIDRRFGRTVSGKFDPMTSLGGSLRQLFSLGEFNNPNLPSSSRGLASSSNPTLCCVLPEKEPSQATIKNVGRIAPALFGLGLVDAIPDTFFDGLAASEPVAVRGIVSRVPVLLPNPGDPTQSIGSTRVGRFGWKAAIPTLLQFVADEYASDVAITTQHCFRGTSVNTFAVENAPNAPKGSVPDGCDDLAPRQPASFGPSVGLSASRGAQVDKAVGACTTGRTQVQRDVFLTAAFLTALAPPPRDFTNADAISRGAPLFTQVGCNGCHSTLNFRTPFASPVLDPVGDGAEVMRVPGGFLFQPYSDFLKHDMGPLGDRIGSDPLPAGGETTAATKFMRTAPLWGIRFRKHLLHDGRTSSVDTAIRAHDGQAAAARNAYKSLTGAEQSDVVAFIKSL